MCLLAQVFIEIALKYLSDHVSVEIEEEAGAFERHQFPVAEPEMAAL